MILIEDQLDESLSLPWELALHFGLIIIFVLILHLISFGVIVVIIFVTSLEECILSLLCWFRTIFPFVAGLVFEFLVELL